MTVPRKRLILFLTLLLAGIGGSLLPGRLSVTLTPSVKHRIWWLSNDFSHVQHGQYVLFRLSSSRLEGMAVPDAVRSGTEIRAIKRVGCDEGEELRRKNRDFFCGDEFLVHAKEKSQKGKLLKPSLFTGQIPKGQAFLVGDHPDSFDSRYFGLVAKKNYLAWARPLF